MYKKIDSAAEKFLRGEGVVAFVPVDDVGPHETFSNYVKHRIKYVYLSNDHMDELGQFYLMRSANHYTMGSVEFTRECDPGMAVFFLNLIVEKAVKNAKNNGAKELAMISRNKLIVEAFLDNGFAVREVGKSMAATDSVYKGIKTFE